MNKATKILSEYLKKLAESPETMTDDGEILTKAEALAKMVWDNALGKTWFDSSTGKRHTTKAQQWAIQLIFERIEGRVPNVTEDNTTSVGIAEKVSELVSTAMNDIAENVTRKENRDNKA